MKTIVWKETRESILIESDETPIFVFDNKVVVGDGQNKYSIFDMNKNNIYLYDGVTVPSDWFPYKYCFNGSSWSANPDFYLQTQIPGDD